MCVCVARSLLETSESVPEKKQEREGGLIFTAMISVHCHWINTERAIMSLSTVTD